MNDLNEDEVVDDLIDVVIENTLRIFGLDNSAVSRPDETRRRAVIYRRVAKELNTLARHLDMEVRRS